MNIENFKTILLINLVAISLFLSYSLWTWQPASDSTSKQKYVQEDTEIQQKKVADFIFPTQMLVHRENDHIVSMKGSDIAAMYHALEEGEFDNFRDISNKIPREEFLSFVHGEFKTELVFNTDITFTTMRNIFSIKHKGLNSYSFDRIVIHLPPDKQEEELKVYFISYDYQKVYEMTMTGYAVQQLEMIQNQFVEKAAQKYFMYRVSDQRAIFLPETEQKMPSIPYIASEMSRDMLKNALFTDPRYVKEEETKTEESYTDGTRLLQVKKDKRMISYENSAVAGNGYVSSSALVQKSIDFINSHGGWTDTYRLYDVNAKRGQTSFRLYVDNSYPVFTRSGIAALKQSWGTEELSKYERPLLQLNLKGEEEDVMLPSGRAIIAQLTNATSHNAKELRSIYIGYEIIPQSGRGGGTVNVIKLEPIWVIAYKSPKTGIYYKRFSGVEGGDLIGLD
ncbi:two-component system activity regulator YycH [Ectobacillus sp. JY-23]|uniref:YycH family regulatory protein n=1 Tax=Ectobacillus sp. JY-23 TaxID=2933872 RepID=UPI001FF6080E|nr:two-component system activity regulator YycH [Ectobacillus sp. JY-23]UOY91352.1 two-component system activity regulator YycH [Ectobacillus sp. JY-23]